MVAGQSVRQQVVLQLLMTALVVASLWFVLWQAVWPRPCQLAGFTVDRLSAVLTLLVSAVGLVTFRFSLRYLDGERAQARFLRVLCLTVCSAYALMLSTHLLMLLATWTLTSAGLHLLLTFYSGRTEARAPARKKFVISRIGDLMLIAAICLIWREYATFDLNIILSQLDRSGGGSDWIAVLLAIAALTKSAQFPFHSWLPETMEAPTPVSALMHAGIINAGGAMLIRFAPLIARSAPALMLLVCVGTLTCALGMLCMWAQVNVKRTLAWSTVSQMGFMMVQCGLCAFPAATLHILGHGFYKAWSFLRTGSLSTAPLAIKTASPQRSLLIGAAGTLAALPALFLAARISGFSATSSPGEFGLACILALSIGQLWVALLGPIFRHRSAIGWRVATALGLTPIAALLALCLYHSSQVFFRPVLGNDVALQGPAAWVTASLPVLAVALLIVLHAFLPVLDRKTYGRALRVHALQGFYFGTIADRLIESLWGIFTRKEVSHA